MTGAAIAADARARGNTVLSLEHITKRFRSTVALDDVSLDLRRGTVHALLGENGAGKTTLMRVAFGLLRSDSGVVRAGERSRVITSTADAIASGIGMVHQHFTNVPAMSVAENVALGRTGRYDAARARERVSDISMRAGLPLDPSARADELSVGGQQRLEIVKALAHDASILILDEPTAVLAPAESEELLRWLHRFADEGNAVVIITHKLREALAVAHDVTVLRHGRVVLQRDARGATEHELARAMLGGEIAGESVGPGERTRGNIIASLRGVRVDDSRGATKLYDVSLDVHGGEIVGVAAVEGAGQHELLRALAGRVEITRGTAELPPVIGFVPEDRHRDALVLEFDATENVALRDAGPRRGVMRWRAERARATRLIEAFDVRGGAPDRRAGALSGGNQQKLVVARELDGDPSLLVAENPTRGLDIRATRSVHDLLRGVARRGGGVIVYSTDLDEVLSLSTRVVAVHSGKVIATSGTRDAVGRAMLGLA
ncbi:MAG TPA: ABC transporter ATP-binding protein [Gemmatimonadaceae bacterium]|nr:ABC transporter ATP-binding protein [Gemmatimonadaceae bacterium]